jgi:hypothetical protein
MDITNKQLQLLQQPLIFLSQYGRTAAAGCSSCATSIAASRSQRPGSRSPHRRLGRRWWLRRGRSVLLWILALLLLLKIWGTRRWLGFWWVLGFYSLLLVSSKVMGQGLQQPAPRIHPLCCFFYVFCCFSVLQQDFLDVATDDSQILQ